ncbi:ATP binding protein [Aureococcus anophagefferens]|nr:ATP binding protein [Aureococcus anophagefferens]
MNVMDEALHDDDEPAPLLVPYAGGASPVVAGPGGRAKVPVTILCGFLGAGKSTLLRRLLAGDHGLRIAVVENEFADTRGLESVLVSEGACALSPDGAIVASPAPTVELRNGCVCCSVKDELATALEDLVARAARPLDAIVVELSGGVADPGPVAAAFWPLIGARGARRPTRRAPAAP